MRSKLGATKRWQRTHKEESWSYAEQVEISWRTNLVEVTMMIEVIDRQQILLENVRWL